MISQTRYVDIVSAVGAGAVVASRQLILRVITSNNLLPPGIVMQASSADPIGSYFGTSSEEYKRAVKYFAFVSKSVTSPPLISFSRWVSSAIAPMIVGDSLAKSLSSFTALSQGTLTLSDGSADAIVISNLNFSTATTLTQVASILQTALQATASAQLASATVTYNTSTNQFTLTGSNPGAGTLSASPTETAADVSQILGWTTSGSVLVSGQAADDMLGAVQKSAAISNNFGSFVFAGQSANVSADQITAITAVAAWVDSLNEMYMYLVPVTIAQLSALYTAVNGYSGVGLVVTSSSQVNDYIDQFPGEIFGATDYTKPNASQNYMYQQSASRNVTVTDDTVADTVDALRGNYIGQTQQAGQPLPFFQRGVLCGGSSAATAMNTFANEIWLKASITSKMLGLFLSVPEVPANETGTAMILAVLQAIFDTALSNGVFSVGKTLTQAQQQYITTLTGDNTAWRQVQSIGYWITITYSQTTNENSGLTEYVANYTLVYSKSDAILKVNGSDVMI